MVIICMVVWVALARGQEGMSYTYIYIPIHIHIYHRKDTSNQKPPPI